MKYYEIKQAFKNLPDAGLPDNESVTCREYEQCKGCNYPAHGFICWHGDGKCLRTEMQEATRAAEPTTPTLRRFRKSRSSFGSLPTIS